MARYCCSQCGSPLQFMAVLTAFLPSLLRCTQCNQKIDLDYSSAWLLFVVLSVCVLSLAVWMGFAGFSLVDTASTVLLAGVMSEWVYFKALASGWMRSSLVRESDVARYPDMPLDDLPLTIPEQWQVVPENAGYRACSPDGSQYLYIKYLERDYAMLADEWVDTMRDMLMKTRYQPTLNRFAIMNEEVSTSEGRASITLDGFDAVMGYRLLAQQLQLETGIVSLALHQFSCESYDEAVLNAAICLPVRSVLKTGS